MNLNYNNQTSERVSIPNKPLKNMVKDQLTHKNELESLRMI